MIVPGRVNVEVNSIETPHAQPASMVLQSAAGIKFLVAGGLTKLEWVAAHIAAGMRHDCESSASLELNVRAAVKMASMVLAECQRVAQTQAAESPEVPNPQLVQ